MLRRTTSPPARRRLGALVVTLGLSLAGAALPAGSAAAAGDEWATVAPMAQSRERHVMAPLPNGTVLVAGGISGSGSYTRSAEVYDPAADSWTAASSLSTFRVDATATPLLDGRVLVFAGESFFGVNTPASTGDIYNPVSGTWSTTAPASRFYGGQTATRLLDGRVLVVGGNAVTGGRETRAEIYDPVANTWTSVAPMSAPRIAHSATLLADGTVLVAGGVGNAGDAVDTAEVYDPLTDSWTSTEPMPAARDSQTATRLDDGRVLLVGGTNSGNAPLASAVVYSPVTNSFTATDSLDLARTYHTAVTLTDGDVLVAGGESGEGYLPVTSVEVYDTATSTWSTVDPMNGDRSLHTALTLDDGTVLVAGGYDNATFAGVSSVERYTPVATAVDSDGDSVLDPVDNCPTVSNASQADSDDDGLGDRCEPTHARSLTLDARDTAKRGDNRVVLSGRLSVADTTTRCVTDERVLLERYDARTSRWVRVGVDRTSSGDRPGRFSLQTADVRATYRASVTKRTVTAGGFTSTCSAASARERHSHYAG